MEQQQQQLQPLPQSVSNWLYNVLQAQYIYKQITYHHLYQFLQVHLKKNLNFKVRTQVYTSNTSGKSDLLINLYGTIHVNDQIEVPVEIWVPLSYPFIDSPEKGVPQVYIVPDHTKNYYLKPGNQVDSQGKFYHPYLSSWYNECNSNNQDSQTRFNLLELINVVYQSVIVDPPVSSSPPIVHASSSSDAVPQLPPKPAKVPLHQPPVLNMAQVQSPQLTGPPSVGIPQSANPQYTGPKNEVNSMGPQTTGPPLPAKPPKLQTPTTQTINPIPLKYQAPLPLPGEQPQSQSQMQPQLPVQPEYQHFNQASPPPPFSATHFNYPKETSASPIQPIPYGPQKAAPSPQQHNIQPGSRYTQQRFEHPQERHPVHVQHQPNLPTAKQPVVDLMDAVASSSKGSTSTQSDAQRRQMLEQLSIKINSYLTDPTNDSVNSDVPMVNEHANKAEALYNQLNHHYQQALGNTRNLDDHLMYLTTQLTHVSNLNQELMKLEELNSASKDKVYTGINTALTLDDLIIPDSPLVKQLYETVSEIKSIKDTINLISGNFHNQAELINDSRLDACIKTVRNLGRELFWLELIKDEIAHSIMNLPRK